MIKRCSKVSALKSVLLLLQALVHDRSNLSILATAKKLNGKIITISRENELEDFSTL